MSDLPVRFVIGALDPAVDPLVFVCDGNNFVMRRGPDGLLLPRRSALATLALDGWTTLGTLDGEAYVAVRSGLTPAMIEANDLTVVGFRSLFGVFSTDVFAVAGLATQLLHFEAVSRHCSQCGQPLVWRTDAPAARFGVKACSTCEREVYPHVSPCAIVLVSRGDEVLLTRKSIFPDGFYGLVAGFLEPAETLESCARREVLEETGITIDDVRYFGSQPWPFPSQLMVGFVARYVSGDVVVDTTELEDARWFHRDALPNLPPPVSIARRMIDAWIATR